MWINVKNVTPPENVYVETKIEDEKGERNHTILRLQGNLWFLKDGTYVYYTPTHWKLIKESKNV